MCWRGLLARDEAGWHGFLGDRKQGLALGPIKHVEHAGLGGLDDRRHRHSLDFDVAQHGLRGEIVIPQIVMHELLVPHQFAALGIQRQERVGEAIAAEAGAAEEVRAGGACWDQDQAAVLIDGHRAPGVARAGRGGLREIPLRGGGVRRRVRYGIEGPEQRAVAGIEGADHTAFHVRCPVVADRGADHNNITVDGGR